MPTTKKSNDSGVIFGFVIIAIGVIWLFKRMGIFIPDWLISWPMILIAIGSFTLIKQEFKSVIGAILLGFGVYFLFRNEFGFDFGIGKYILPIGIILLGIYMVTQRRRENKILSDLDKKLNNPGNEFNDSLNDTLGEDVDDGEDTTSNPFMSEGSTFSDYLKIDAVLSGVNKRVMSKDFQGGKITALFGGADIDFSQADFNGMVTIQLDVIFGGMKLIVPPHWDVRTEVSNIAAGIDDNRIYRQTEVDPQKILLLKGTVMFGGLEIKSF